MEHNPRSNQPVDKPVWTQDFEMPTFPSLDRNLDVEVCVVGGGIAGLSTAYLLSEAGKSVALIDDGPLCEGATQYTTGHLSSALDDRYVEIERWHGEEGARLAAESHVAAINQIETIVNNEQIACGFSRLSGYLFLSPEEDKSLLYRERDAAHRAGLEGVRLLHASPLLDRDLGPCLVFPNQAQFHPLQYLAGLAEAIVRKGNFIFTHTHADRVKGGRTARVETGKFLVVADDVVVATNSPVVDRLSIHTKQASYMSYVIGARVPSGSVPRGLYWDTGDPYHYVRTQPSAHPDYDTLIIGGEDHRVGQADDADFRHSRLEKWARRYFPMMEAVEFKWAGQIMETVDGLAYIGRNPLDRHNVYVCTGDSGMGLTHGTIAGMLITDLILDVPNPWADLYNPSRKSLAAIGEYITENLNTASQYQDWFTDGDVESMDEIPYGSGAIIREGSSKFAVYRDEEGQFYKYSAVCPHLGGIVRWNSVDKLWDCPCHGSRFSQSGQVIAGPANEGLKPIDDPALATPHGDFHEKADSSF